MGLILTKWIEHEAKNNSILTANIEGKLGIGKSAYAIKVAREYYQNQGYSKNEAYQKAIDSIAFLPSEFARLIDDRCDIIIMDDASLHSGSHLYRTDFDKYSTLMDLTTVMRTSTNGVLFTTPTISKLASFIRDSDAYNILINKQNGEYERAATIYGWRRIATRMGIRRISIKKAVDKYSCYIPNFYYKQYLERRRKYVDKPKEKLLSGELDG